MGNILDDSKGKKIENSYGIKRQRLIKDSGVRSIFTPRTPIKDVNLFSGREQEVEKLLEYITSPGLHALLYGDRGVGKSSLANITTLLILRDFHPELFRKSCSISDTFESVFERPLLHLGFDRGVKTKEITDTTKAKAGIDLLGFTLGGGIDEAQKYSVTKNQEMLRPSDVAHLLKDLDALMVIDELDRLPKTEIEKISELIKILSDHSSPFKLLLVGIAHNSKELIGGHLSVQRCLMQTNLVPMSNAELKKIIDDGEKQTKPPIRFSEAAKKQIVQLSSGYPHFTHLLALKAAEEAIASEKRDVTVQDLVRAVNAAREDAEEGLREQYEAAISSDKSGLTKRILVALAKSPGSEYTFFDIKRMIKSIFGEDPEEGKLRYRLRLISSPTPDTVLRVKSKGKYIINDPRMMCYIRIMNPDHFREYMV